MRRPRGHYSLVTTSARTMANQCHKANHNSLCYISFCYRCNELLCLCCVALREHSGHAIEDDLNLENVRSVIMARIEAWPALRVANAEWGETSARIKSLCSEHERLREESDRVNDEIVACIDRVEAAERELQQFIRREKEQGRLGLVDTEKVIELHQLQREQQTKQREADETFSKIYEALEQVSEERDALLRENEQRAEEIETLRRHQGTVSLDIRSATTFQQLITTPQGVEDQTMVRSPLSGVTV